MTRFLIAFLALLGLAAQAPACPRLAERRAEFGLVAAQRVAVRTSQPAAIGPAATLQTRIDHPATGTGPAVASPVPMLRAPVLTGIDRAHE